VRSLLDRLCPDGFPVPVAVRDLAVELQRVNQELWRLEDAARAAQQDETLGRLKRAVDWHNLRRADLVTNIDRLVFEAVSASVPGTPPLSCSVGATLDRLTVALLRARVLREAYDERADDALRQLDDLCVAARADWADLRQGRRRLPLPGVLKRYSPAASDPPAAIRGGPRQPPGP
jgi:hypothetical protein